MFPAILLHVTYLFSAAAVRNLLLTSPGLGGNYKNFPFLNENKVYAVSKSQSAAIITNETALKTTNADF